MDRTVLSIRSLCALLILPCLGVAPQAFGDSPTEADCLSFDAEASHSTPHFDIGYTLSGSHAVAPSDGEVIVTRSDGLIIGYTVPDDGIPDYVEEAGIALEYAYVQYQGAGLRLPARQEVYIRGDLGAYGLYLPQCDEIFLDPELRLLTHTSAHELFHAVQYEYWDVEDFSGIPAAQQPFYKEATADAAMMQVMRPSPYVSWFESPDQGSIFEAGTGAAFFWVYYGEQLSDAPPSYEVLPGLVGMARYLEVVARAGVGLEDALSLLPEEDGRDLSAMMESRVLADLLHDPLRYIDPFQSPYQAPFTYAFEYVRGFYNSVIPQAFAMEGVEGDGRLRRFTIGGEISYRWNAQYHQLPEALYRNGGLLMAEMAPGSGVSGAAYLVAIAVEGMEVKHFNSQRLAPGQKGGFYIPPIPGMMVFVVGQSTTGDDWRYDLDLRFLGL